MLLEIDKLSTTEVFYNEFFLNYNKKGYFGLLIISFSEYSVSSFIFICKVQQFAVTVSTSCVVCLFIIRFSIFYSVFLCWLLLVLLSWLPFIVWFEFFINRYSLCWFKFSKNHFSFLILFSFVFVKMNYSHARF